MRGTSFFGRNVCMPRLMSGAESPLVRTGKQLRRCRGRRVGGVSAQWRQRQSQWRPRLPVRSEAEVSATPGSPHEIGCIFTGQWRGPGVVSFSEVAGLRRLRSGGGCLAGRRISPRLEPPTAVGADGRAVGTVSGARAKSRDRRLASIVKGKRTSVVLGWRRVLHTLSVASRSSASDWELRRPR